MVLSSAFSHIVQRAPRIRPPQGTFKVRALVRNVEGAQAQGSRDRGAEVAAADVYDAKSLEEAVKGCHGLFVVTFLHPHTDPEREHKQCQNAAQAAKAAGAVMERHWRCEPPCGFVMTGRAWHYRICHTIATPSTPHRPHPTLAPPLSTTLRT